MDSLDVPNETNFGTTSETIKVKKRLNSVLRHVQEYVDQQGQNREMMDALKAFRQSIETASTMNGIKSLYQDINERVERSDTLNDFLTEDKASKIQTTWKVIRANLETHFNIGVTTP
jgi:hypothetical protein